MLGVSVQAIGNRAKRESWQARPRRARGGGSEWLLSSMPKPTLDAVIAAQLAERGVALPEAQAPAKPSPVSGAASLAHMTEARRSVVEARMAFLREIDRLAVITGTEAAIRHLVEAAQGGTLTERLARLIPVANAKYGRGEARGLSRRRLYEWRSLFTQGGELALAPRNPQKDMAVPGWAPLFLEHYPRPQNPTLAEAHRDFSRAWKARYASLPPSIHAVRRFLDKVARPDLEAGRKTGNALLKLKPYVKRNTAELLPCDVYTADGTTFDAEIQHPDTGRPFKPEIVLMLDVATRRCVGLSVALAESAAATLDALRMACLFGGIPAMLYTDNGPGYRNALLSGPGSGMLGRLGIEMRNSIPGRPQGKGLMERAVQTICAPASKQLVTCTHADMDGDAQKKVYKITRAQLKAHGRSSLLPTWDEFKRVLLARVEEYNATPHRALPMMVDEAQARRRHMSPNEYWQHCLGRVFEPVPVPEDLRDDLFMPATMRKVQNGMVRLWNRNYFAHELANHHGDLVEVRYDVWDASYVSVWTEAGEKICRAELDANTINYFPPSVIEAARARRQQAQLKRLEKKAQAIAPGAELSLPEAPSAFLADVLTPRQPLAAHLEPQPEPITTQADLEAIRAVMERAEHEQAQPQPALTKRPLWSRSPDKYRWLLSHRADWTDADRAWLAEYASSTEYALLRERYEHEGLVLGNALGDGAEFHGR